MLYFNTNLVATLNSALFANAMAIREPSDWSATNDKVSAGSLPKTVASAILLPDSMS